MEDLLLCKEEHTLSSPPASNHAAESLDPVQVIRLLADRERDYDGLNPGFLKDVQRHGMEASWRRKICRWMFETAKAFELAHDTVGCAVFFMDRYLSTSSVDKIMLQLVSMVSMYIASKMHEHQPISMEEMDLLSQRKFSRDDIRRVESQLLQLLDWRLNPPTSFTFARDFIGILSQTTDVELDELFDDVMSFLQEVTEEYGSLRFQTSSLGIAAVHVLWNAKKMRPGAFIQDAIHALDIVGSDFVDCYRWLRQLYHAKYQQPRFVSVEESKSPDASRSISPTSVDDPFVAACASVPPEVLSTAGLGYESKSRAPRSPDGQGAAKRARRGD
ncbi:hypothetical protein ATCC90586_009885 [Pythium insidiosum]|nr:hypothetical protein ATCC90586_009885 [Pythium insidiosum]